MILKPIQDRKPGQVAVNGTEPHSTSGSGSGSSNNENNTEREDEEE